MTKDNGQPQPDPPKVDLTEERRKRCEPIALKILEMMLADERILLADVTFIEQVVKEQFEALFKGIVYQHLQEVFNLVFKSLQISINKANEMKWGKPNADITAADVDKVLIAQEKEKKS